MDRTELSGRYLEAAGRYKDLKSAEEKKLLILAFSRLFAFVGGIVIVWLGFISGLIAGIIALVLFISVFFLLLRLWAVHTGRKIFFSNLADINQRESDAMGGNISSFKPGKEYQDISHDFSNDLDIFGESSLFQYLDRSVTDYGSDILAGWLTSPFQLSASLELRQEAIKEIAANEKFRHEFMARGMQTSLGKEDIKSLLGWMEEDDSPASSGTLKFLSWFLPSLATGSLLLALAGLLSFSFFTLFFLINLTYIAAGLKKINRIHDAVSRKHLFLSSLYRLLTTFENVEFRSEELQHIRKSVNAGRESASVAVGRLSNIVKAFDTRLNFLAGILLNGLLLWDYQNILKLARWKREYRNLLPLWLEMTGRTDAFISLGNYAFNNPGFSFPSTSNADMVIDAVGLGHPLIDESVRVCNDFMLQRKKICIITGANMAGKSTFLRSVAVNYILAMTGAPVCASSMSFLPMKPFTSMRTTDSLNRNESYFYAELKRLKLLRDRIMSGEEMLFILDEILKGTNSNDKSTGSKLFLEKMVLNGGNGLIATHDIALGELEKDHPKSVFNKCFEIEIEGDLIRFDYLLRDGITHKMNASLLMNQMGILE